MVVHRQLAKSKRVARSKNKTVDVLWGEHTPEGALLFRTAQLANQFLTEIDARPVYPATTFQELVADLGGPLQASSLAPTEVIEALAAKAEPGLVATPGPRYFGFVIGGSVPAAVAADWLTSAWDQCAAFHVHSPAVAAIEHVTAGWLLDLLGLPPTASVGFVTGATMASVTALAAARHEVLRRVGWDVEADGLQRAPRVTVIAGARAHASIRSAVRLVGLGASSIRYVAADAQGRMRSDDLKSEMTTIDGPTIVCAQAGEVNTGAFDPLAEIEPLVHERGAWLHVDGAFGLWAGASRSLRPLVDGCARADSWALDAHKWLNVPFDSGIVIVAHAAAHRASMSQTAAYLLRAVNEERDGSDWTPEVSRRARAIPIYAALRSLGREGLEALLDRCCGCARMLRDHLSHEPGIEILNEVVLNQVLVRCRDRAGTNISASVIVRTQEQRVCWVGGTEWQGEAAMRVSVSNWRTTSEDIDRSAQSIIQSVRHVRSD